MPDRSQDWRTGYKAAYDEWRRVLQPLPMLGSLKDFTPIAVYSQLIQSFGMIPKYKFRVISGGQTGVDVAGLLAAAESGLETGGWMPNKWRTDEGPHPEYADVFGMKEHAEYSYAGRTIANVRMSDTTILIAKDFKSPGTMMTWSACDSEHKPYSRVLWGGKGFSYEPDALAHEILTHTVAADGETLVINVAGNREKSAPGIFTATVPYLALVFQELVKGLPAIENDAH